MADTTATKNVLSLVATTSSKIRDLIIKNGQLIFIKDVGRIAMDLDGKRIFYNQIVELETEAERQALEMPLNGYYFVVDEAVLWFYKDGWVQITEKPKEVIFIGVELPELGQANKLYVDVDDKEIFVWDEKTSQYVVVSNYIEDATTEDIEKMFR